jgi:outer membrane lipoprotein-sorting protein
MHKILPILVCAFIASSCTAAEPNKPVPQNSAAIAGPNDVDNLLARLNAKSRETKTYQAKITYLFSQPLLDSQTFRTGTLYYFNNDKLSKLRIDFSTLKQDTEPTENYTEQYLFDGVTLTIIDYKQRTVEYRQLAEANQPLNAFDLASRYLPIIGFADTGRLRTEFTISLAGEANGLTRLHLITKPTSQFKDDYAWIDFWLDTKTLLPARMLSHSPQDEYISDIRLSDAVVNKPLDSAVFNIKVPLDFGVHRVPLEEARKGRNNG